MMAARKHLSHDQKTRERIQTSQLVNRLTDNALGKIELTAVQVRSIEILLKKSLPDLSAVEHTGGVDHNVKVSGALAWKPPQ
jgi:hypothetical protein